jgi:7-carboxy-7-deazaguanine synthase
METTKLQIAAGTHLPLMEDFYTIQGEGKNAGQAAYFIRLAGCDVGCVWCDVKDSWDAVGFPVVDVEAMADKAAATGTPQVVITGGEPAMYDLTKLTQAIQKRGMLTLIETSGAYPLTGTWNWVCLSPKKFKKPVDSIMPLSHELKVVVFNKSDFKWAEDHAAKVSADCKLYLQPEWDQSEKMLPLIIDYVKQNPQWEISLQLHKFMEIP